MDGVVRMETKNDPAFPITIDAISFGNKEFPMQGLTKLEWFAGMIAQGMAASRYWAENVNNDSATMRAFAFQAFFAAEAMLAESEKRK